MNSSPDPESSIFANKGWTWGLGLDSFEIFTWCWILHFNNSFLAFKQRKCLTLKNLEFNQSIKDWPNEMEWPISDQVWWYNRGNLSMFTVCDYSRFAWPQNFPHGPRDMAKSEWTRLNHTHSNPLQNFQNFTIRITWLYWVSVRLYVSHRSIVGCLELDCLFINYNIIIRVKFWQVVIII